jgi:hypothetical protein
MTMTARRPRLARLFLLALLPVASLTVACSGSQPDAGRATTTEPAEERGDTTDPTPGAPAAGSGALVARSDGAVDIHAARGATDVAQTLPPTTEFGSARALMVTSADDEWLEVLLPIRPNGTTGWVRRADVEVREVTHELRIDLTQRTLTLLDGETTVLTTPVAIGSEEAPTPTGRFSIVDKLVTGNDGGAYGPYALGLSGHSEVLTEFAGGDGQIGIHGTNDPDSIGEAVSHGCIRVPNDVITQLNDLLPLGTPVVIG